MACKVNVHDFSCNGKKIVGAAVNYVDVVRQKNLTTPKEPVLFLKPTSSYIEPGQNIVIPSVFNQVAYEVELGVVIDQECKNVSEAEAMKYVGGYCLALDMTAQCFLAEARKNGMPWSLGKGFDTSTPVSKLIPRCEIADPHKLDLWLKVNGETKQKNNTKELIFKVPQLISYISKYMTLQPNDLILTGTPLGSCSVNHGDVIDCGLDKIVRMKFKVVSEDSLKKDEC